MLEIRKLYAMHFLVGLSTAASVTFTLYFLSHGLDQFQIAQLFSVFLFAIAILEIPTGGISDTFGHKTSVILGLISQSLSFLLFFLFPTYLGILIGMLFSALGLALQSGAITSLLYELLKKDEKQKDFQKIYGRANGYLLAAGIIAGPLGSFIYTLHEGLPYLFSFFVVLLAAIVSCFIKWEFKGKSQTFSAYKETMVKGVKLTITHKVLMAIVVIGLALTVNRLLFNQNINQPYLVNIGVPIIYIGVVASIISGILAFISIYSYKITEKIGKEWSLLATILFISFSTFILGLLNSLIALPIMIFLVVGHAFRDPVFTHITHDELDSENRATMASAMNFFTSIAAGLILLLFGAGLDSFGMNNTLYLLGIFTLILGLFGFILFKSKKGNTQH